MSKLDTATKLGILAFIIGGILALINISPTSGSIGAVVIIIFLGMIILSPIVAMISEFGILGVIVLVLAILYAIGKK